MIGQATVYLFDEWQFDSARRELIRPDGYKVNLTTAEYLIFVAFVENPQTPLSRADLVKAMAPPIGRVDEGATDRSVDVVVTRLRRKIEYGANPTMIKTVRYLGYVFAPTVHVITRDDRLPAVISRAPSEAPIQRGTLTVMSLPDRPGVWLCSDDMTSAEPLALFKSLDAARKFIHLFALARAVSHTQGQMGI